MSRDPRDVPSGRVPHQPIITTPGGPPLFGDDTRYPRSMYVGSAAGCVNAITKVAQNVGDTRPSSGGRRAESSARRRAFRNFQMSGHNYHMGRHCLLLPLPID